MECRKIISKQSQNNKNNKYRTPSFTKIFFFIFKALNEQRSELNLTLNKNIEGWTLRLIGIISTIVYNDSVVDLFGKREGVVKI